LTIISDNIKFEDKVWHQKSTDALDLVKKMLKFNVRDRITPDEALKHPWITKSTRLNKNFNEKLYSKHLFHLISL